MVIETVIIRFLRLEASSGILLFVAAVVAMVAVNSPLRDLYDALLNVPVHLSIGEFAISKPLLLWINDGLIGAIGGMSVPAVIYTWINWGNPIALNGWAIPSATDIAFALAVLALLGKNVPSSLKLFLMALAIIDDLGAIVIIAVFYTHEMSLLSLLVASAAAGVLFMFNRRGVLSLVPYLLVGLVLWVAVLKSGVHATLAGVLIAMFIPFRKAPDQKVTQLERLEDDLHPAVVYGILPIFAFANTGISFAGLTFQSLFEPVPMGIAVGLFVGNQIGVLGFCWVAIKLKLARLPKDASWLHLYGVACLCGIGFTMSLFISSLAFGQTGAGSAVHDRLGIIAGSLASAVLGYLVLRFAPAKQQGEVSP
jgi:NhaA family Na+:H+ antiporter